MKKKYKSDIILGDTYRDSQTGLEGIATAVYFYQYGCERVSIETYNEKDKTLASTAFDAPRLVHVKTDQPVTTKRTGGPGNGNESRSVPSR